MAKGQDEYAAYLIPGGSSNSAASTSSAASSSSSVSFVRALSVVALCVGVLGAVLGGVALNNTYNESDRIDALQSSASSSRAVGRSLSALHSSIGAMPFCRDAGNLQDCHDLKNVVSKSVDAWHNISDVWTKPAANPHIASALMDTEGKVLASSKTPDSPALAYVQGAVRNYARGNTSDCTITDGDLCVVDTAGEGVAVISKLLRPVAAAGAVGAGGDRRRGYAKACAEGATGGATAGAIGCVVGPEGCATIAAGAATGCVGSMATHFVDKHWPFNDDDN